MPPEHPHWERATAELPVVLTTGNVADVFQRSADYVQKLSRTGRIPHDLTKGGHRRFHRDDVVAFAQANGWELFPDEIQSAKRKAK